MRIRIGSFNVQNMGLASKKDYEKLAQIITDEQMDIVSLQEILSEGKAIKYNLMHLLPKWDMIFRKPPDSSDPLKSRDQRGEGYAFLWNTRKIGYSDRPSPGGKEDLIPRIAGTKGDGLHIKGVRSMIRSPLYGCFRPVNGGFFDLRLINVHLYFGDNSKSEIQKRQEEYDMLIQNVYPAVSQHRFGNNRPSYTIAMGDYNLNLRKYRGEAEKNIIESTYISGEPQGDQHIKTVQDELTSLKKPKDDKESSRGYSQNYDHFSYSVSELMRSGAFCKYRRIDAVRKYIDDDFDEYRHNISDHVPIVFDLYIGEEDIAYDNNGYRKTS